MQDNSETIAPSSERTTIVAATIALMLLALFAPYIVAYQELSESVRYLVAAVSWSIIDLSGETALILPHPYSIPFIFLFASPRLLFVLAINRFMRKRNQPGEFLLASAILVFQLLAPCLFFYFNPFYIELPGGPLVTRPAPPVGSLICIPAPILLCVGLMVLGLWKTQWPALEPESSNEQAIQPTTSHSKAIILFFELPTVMAVKLSFTADLGCSI
ncbi:MAG: hypothetical protein ACFFAZ_07285 [Promethearchaeota archaeon]